MYDWVDDVRVSNDSGGGGGRTPGTVGTCNQETQEGSTRSSDLVPAAAVDTDMAALVPPRHVLAQCLHVEEPLVAELAQRMDCKSVGSHGEPMVRQCLPRVQAAQ